MYFCDGLKAFPANLFEIEEVACSIETDFLSGPDFDSKIKNLHSKWAKLIWFQKRTLRVLEMNVYISKYCDNVKENV